MARDAKHTPAPAPNGASESQPLSIVGVPAEKDSKRLQYLLQLLALVAIVVGFPLFLQAQHEKNPHKGAVAVKVWEQRNVLEDERNSMTQKKLDELGEHAMGVQSWKARTDAKP